MENITPGQVGEMIALFAKKIPLTMPKGPATEYGTAQYWIDNPDQFQFAITEALFKKAERRHSLGVAHPWIEHTENLLRLQPVCKSWCEFYEKIFGIEMMPEDIYPLIPKRDEGFDRLIVIAKGLRLNLIWHFHKCLRIPIWHWQSGDLLEEAIQDSEVGQVKTTYAIWVRDAQNAIDVDEDLLKKLSAEAIAERGISTESLLERLIHGLKYFNETGNHLDIVGTTLCASSRDVNGNVPDVHRSKDGLVHVDRTLFSDDGTSIVNYRARRVIRKH